MPSQILEASSIIGLIRRTQALVGPGGRRRRCARASSVASPYSPLAAYDPRMATEDIDLTWRLLSGRLAHDLRARRAHRHGGAFDACDSLWGSTSPLGAWARGRCCTRGYATMVALAPPAPVAARVRGGRLAHMGHRVRSRAGSNGDRRRCRQPTVDPSFRLRLGDRRCSRRDAAAGLRTQHRRPLRPPRCDRVPLRPRSIPSPSGSFPRLQRSGPRFRRSASTVPANAASSGTSSASESGLFRARVAREEAARDTA